MELRILRLQTEQSTYLGSFSGKTTAIDAAEVLEAADADLASILREED